MSENKYFELPTDKIILILLTLCVLVGLYDLFILFIGLNNPLIGPHSFRQTQTALSTYWMLQGGPLLAYETPVVGAPWSIPTEFPLYQWVVALLALTGVPLEASGRIISFLFFVGCLWPLHIIYKRLNIGSFAYLITAALFLASPIYIFWSRTFLIETSALFFALLWLALFIEYINRASLKLFIGVLIAGTLGALVKSTTFPAFAFLGGLFFLYTVFTDCKKGRSSASLKKWAALIVLLIFPFVPAVLWVMYSDAIKLANPIGQNFTSSALFRWNFGTLDQRASLALWKDTILMRAVPDILGYTAYVIFGFGFFAIAIFGLKSVFGSMLSLRHRWFIFALVFTFLLPFVIFTNVHMQHNYYQTANALFLIAAVGLVIDTIARNGHRNAAVVMATVMIAGQLAFFQINFFKHVTKTTNNWLRIGLTARSMTPPGSSLIVIGMGWTSHVPYHSQRKSLAIPNGLSEEMVDRIVDNPEDFLGGIELGGIVECWTPSGKHIIEKFLPITERMTIVAREGGCKLYM